jgi:N-acetylglucosaminyldiphosphoundecaprenol N-acetyl-beta-D-mannosaminyltransferase
MAEQPNSYNSEHLPNLNVHLLGRRITCMTVPAIVEAIHAACVKGRKMTVANYNLHSFNLSMQIPWFYDFVQNAEIAHCDSFGILLAIRYMGLNLPIEYRASYTYLMPKLLENCNQHGFSVFLLGSKPHYLETALERLRKQYPKIRLAGHHGYFAREGSQENEAVIQQINLAKPDILIVGMGMPTQEKWIQLHRRRLNANVIMLGGAIIDRLAGVVSDCPAILSNVGLEWLYRLGHEPKRLAARYLLGNPAFVLHLALAKFYESSFRVDEKQASSSSNPEAKERLGNLSLTSMSQGEFPATIHPDDKHFADYLTEAGLLTEAQIDTALLEQKVTGKRLSEILVQKGLLKQQTSDFFMKNLLLSGKAVSMQSSFYTERMPLLQ